MSEATSLKNQKNYRITVEEVNRVLEIGWLLFSVLTPEEIEQVQQLLNGGDDTQNTQFAYPKKGNTSVS